MLLPEPADELTLRILRLRPVQLAARDPHLELGQVRAGQIRRRGRTAKRRETCSQRAALSSLGGDLALDRAEGCLDGGDENAEVLLRLADLVRRRGERPVDRRLGPQGLTGVVDQRADPVEVDRVAGRGELAPDDPASPAAGEPERGLVPPGS